MDEAVKTHPRIAMKSGLARTLFCTLMLSAAVGQAAGVASVAAVSTAPAAQGLQDPTRPPAGALPLAMGASAAADQGPQLQSVTLGGAGRRSAVIDGESVRVGERFRGARVMRIADNEVELLRGRERQVLRLYAPASDGGMTRVAPSGVPASGPAGARRAKGEP
jgi:MSHA biogenesis protein MshK